MLVWLSASVIENTLIVLDLEVVQVVYEPAALCSEILETLERCLDELRTAKRHNSQS